MDSNPRDVTDLASAQPAVSEMVSVSGLTLTPTPSTCPTPIAPMALTEQEARLPALLEAEHLEEPEEQLPSPSAKFLAALQGGDVDEVEASLVSVRDAWRRGNQSAIAGALIAQAALLEAIGVKLLKLSGLENNVRAVQGYGNLGLRALEQSRKTLATVAGLREKPCIQTTNVQVNLGGPSNEKLVNDHGQE